MSEIDLLGSPDKIIVAELLNRLPDDATLDDILEEVQVLIALREADEDISAGRLIPHEEVKRIVASWIASPIGD